MIANNLVSGPNDRDALLGPLTPRKLGRQTLRDPREIEQHFSALMLGPLGGLHTGKLTASLGGKSTETPPT